MPFYKISEMEEKRSSAGHRGAGKSVAGELIKVGINTYQMGEGPPPHFHPNEEQFVIILQGKAMMVCGDEERLVEPGYLIHVPRGMTHGARVVEAPHVFFAAKSPVGTGDMAQDYNKAKKDDTVWKRLSDL